MCIRDREGAPLSRQCTHTGWFAKIKLTDPAELEGLLSEEAYKKLLE